MRSLILPSLKRQLNNLILGVAQSHPILHTKGYKLMKISVLDALTLGADLDLSPLNKFGDVRIFGTTAPNKVEENIADSDVIVINKVKVNKTNLENAKNLKIILEMATGFDNIDLEYCKEKGIAVCNVVGYSTMSVSQITVCMALSLISNMKTYSTACADGSYSRGSVANILTPTYHDICGKTWGIVGYGNIGKQVANVARALGCRIIAYKRMPVDDVECVDIDTLCKRADIISVHTPLNDGTRNLINKERIALMKKDAIVINVARGAVCDEKELANAIKERRIGGLGVDVYTQEPYPITHPYSEISRYDNTLFTPHMAWGSYESRSRCLDEAIMNLEAFLRGEKRNRLV